MSLGSINQETAIKKMTQSLPALRTMLQLSQAQLAELIGVGRQTLVAFETGKRTMTWNTFLSLLFVFSQREETKELLCVLGIYTNELKSVYRGK
jgi:DNA-binding XRE family transcriptional regulator